MLGGPIRAAKLDDIARKTYPWLLAFHEVGLREEPAASSICDPNPNAGIGSRTAMTRSRPMPSPSSFIRK
jgi:hypothetical protein